MATRNVQTIKALAFIAGINPKPTVAELNREFNSRTTTAIIAAGHAEIVKDRVYLTAAGVDALHVGK